jgi:hypothetical protein
MRKKKTIKDIKIELQKLGFLLISKEIKRGRMLIIQCNKCNRIIKGNLIDFKKGKKCFFCFNNDLIENYKKELIQFLNTFKIDLIITDYLILKFIKYPIQIKRWILKNHNPIEFKKLLTFGRTPINILDQIKYLNSIGLTSYKISKQIRKENNYIISRSKVDNINKLQ